MRLSDLVLLRSALRNQKRIAEREYARLVAYAHDAAAAIDYRGAHLDIDSLEKQIDEAITANKSNVVDINSARTGTSS